MTAVQTVATMSKGEFARLINVSPGRVSQYIASGQIGPDALDGEGRSARIIVDKATRQLNARLDVAQRVGINGIGTRLSSDAPSPEAAPSQNSLPIELLRTQSDIVADQIAREKLEQAKMQTARARRDEALAAGRYMLADEARAETAKAVGMAFRVMEGGLADMASELAARFEIPQRDIMHQLQKSFRGVRERAAQGFRNEAEALDKTVVDQVGEEDQ